MHSWMSLPEDLLLLVLSHLHGQDLMTIRLVCRDWRRPTLAFVKSLDLNNWPEFSLAQGLHLPHETLRSRLQTLPNLSHLSFRAFAPHEPSLLSVPACSTILYSLSICYDSMAMAVAARQMIPGIARCIPILAADLAPLSHLAALTHLEATAPLRVGATYGIGIQNSWKFTSQILRQCTNLFWIDLKTFSSQHWMHFLEHMAELPQLRMLGDVPLSIMGGIDDDMVQAVAALTQVTNLQCSMEADPEENCLDLVSELPALRRLSLKIPPLTPLESVEPVKQLSQLDELRLAVLEGDLPQANVEAIISSLGSLTRLEFQASPLQFPDILPVLLRQRSLAKLECLIWKCATLGLDPVAFPTSLKSVYVKFGGVRNEQMPPSSSPGLLSSLAALTGLTSLSLSVKIMDGSWITGSGVDARAATFLTALTRLEELKLHFFLHLANVETDVRCLAMLTGLKRLSLRGYCACHSVPLNPGGPVQVYVTSDLDAHPEAQQESQPGDGEDVSLMRCPASFLAFGQRGGLLPLLSLTALGGLTVGGPWRILEGPAFLWAFNAMRHELGRPPLKVTVRNKRIKFK